MSVLFEWGPVRWGITAVLLVMFLGIFFYILRWGQKMLNSGDRITELNEALYKKNVELTREHNRLMREVKGVATLVSAAVSTETSSTGGRHSRRAAEVNTAVTVSADASPMHREMQEVIAKLEEKTATGRPLTPKEDRDLRRIGMPAVPPLPQARTQGMQPIEREAALYAQQADDAPTSPTPAQKPNGDPTQPVKKPSPTRRSTSGATAVSKQAPRKRAPRKQAG
jgi:hypothetical protein